MKSSSTSAGRPRCRVRRDRSDRQGRNLYQLLRRAENAAVANLRGARIDRTRCACAVHADKAGDEFAGRFDDVDFATERTGRSRRRRVARQDDRLAPENFRTHGRQSFPCDRCQARHQQAQPAHHPAIATRTATCCRSTALGRFRRSLDSVPHRSPRRPRSLSQSKPRMKRTALRPRRSLSPHRRQMNQPAADDRWLRGRCLFAFGAVNLPLPETLLLVTQQWRQQIFDDAAPAGLDLDRHRHAGRQFHQCDRRSACWFCPARRAGSVEQFLARRLAAARGVCPGLAAQRCSGWSACRASWRPATH